MSNVTEKELRHLEENFENEEDIERNEAALLDIFKDQQHPLKMLVRLFRGNYRRVLLSQLFCLLKVSPALVRPVITAAMIDLVVDAIKTDSAPDWTRLIIYFCVVLFLVVANVPLNYIHTLYYSKANRSMEAGLRSAMVRRLQHLSIGFHHEMQSGRIQSKVMRDVENVEGMSVSLLTGYTEVILTLLTSLVVTLTKNFTVFLMYLFLVPVSVAIIMLFRKTLSGQNQRFRNEVESTSAAVMEMVEMIPVTKAHALENTESRKISNQLKRTAGRGYALDLLQGFFGSIVWASTQTFELICLLLTCLFAINKIISIGEITLYQSYFSTIVGNVCSLISLMPLMTRGFESLKSIGDILGSTEYEDNSGKQKMPQLEGKYEFKDVYFRYEGKTLNDKLVLNDLNLTVNKGETIALVGESGSGKTTILNLVIGFYKPIEGQLLIDGQDVATLDLHSYRKHIAMVPQTSILFTGTIRENITYGNPNVSEEQVWQVLKAANLDNVVRNLPQGLDTQVGEHGSKLSGGQRQRVSIARAIIRKPDVIIFDEATSALDSVSEKLIQDSIDYLCRGKTTFIVAHRLSTIRNADKIAVIANGHCVEFGTFDELMEKKGEFYKYKILQS